MFFLNAKLFRFTSSPFCWAGQFVMEREPDMKSFCTSTMIIAVRGLTIYFHRNLCFHYLFFPQNKSVTFLIQPFQQNTNSCLLMLPSPETLKIMKRSLMSWVSILITHCWWQILIRRIHFESLILVRFSFLVSEESFTDCCKLIDVDRIISINEIRNILNVLFSPLFGVLTHPYQKLQNKHPLSFKNVLCCFSLFLFIKLTTSIDWGWGWRSECWGSATGWW